MCLDEFQYGFADPAAAAVTHRKRSRTAATAAPPRAPRGSALFTPDHPVHPFDVLQIVDAFCFFGTLASCKGRNPLTAVSRSRAACIWNLPYD